MLNATDQSLLDAVLDSWDRNNTILVNLLHMLPQGGLEIKATEGSPSVAQMLTHIHCVRLVFVSEDAPEFARDLPERDVPKEEWVVEHHPARIAQMLNESARAVKEAVRGRLEAGKEMDLNYDHPILMLQHMIWHEGYHHGQIKLALKLAGTPITNKEAGPGTWRVWMNKTKKSGSELMNFALDHLGIAVKSLQSAKAIYDLLGLSVTDQEEVPAEKVRVVMVPVGETRLELLEPTSEDSVIAKFIAKRGEGLHHVSLRVPDLEAAVSKLKQNGVRLVSENVGVGAGGHRYVFVHPSSAGGVLLELVEGL